MGKDYSLQSTTFVEGDAAFTCYKNYFGFNAYILYNYYIFGDNYYAPKFPKRWRLQKLTDTENMRRKMNLFLWLMSLSA